MDSRNVKRNVFSGIFWKFSERFLSQVVSLVVSIVIARILQPEDYSVVSIVTIFFAFANVLISGGLNSALIQKKDADDEDYSSVLHVSVLVSLVIYVGMYIAAPYIAQLYEQDILIPIIRVMSIILPINAVKSIWCARISSSLNFKKFFFSTIGGTVVSGVIGIWMALKGFGAWALVAQQMTNALIGTIIVIITTRIKLKFGISWNKLEGLLKYGWKIFASSILRTVYTELNPLIIGLKFNSADLSFYTKGRSYPNLLSTTTTYTLSAVMFPAMSKYQDDKNALLKYTRLFIRQASFIAFPLMLGFYAVADKFVLLLLTEKWMGVVPYIRIFCISEMFTMIHSGNCETIKAMGRSDIFLTMEIIKKGSYFLIIALFVWLADTPQALAISSIACTVVALIVNMVPNQRLIGYSLLQQLLDLLPNLCIAIAMCVVVSLVGMLPIAAFLLLVLQIITGVAVYVLLNVLFKNPSYIYMLSLVKNLKKVRGRKD